MIKMNWLWISLSIIAPLKMSSKATKKVTYQKMDDGHLCSGSSKRINTYQECMKAAESLGLTFAHIWDGPTDFPGCVHANDFRNTVYFNSSPYPSKTADKWNYAEICQMQPPAARVRVIRITTLQPITEPEKEIKQPEKEITEKPKPKEPTKKKYNTQESPGPCVQDEFECNNKKCIEMAMVCDDESDCSDASDEEFCCEDGEFRCLDRECIDLSSQCDGAKDCTDNEDEEECDYTQEGRDGAMKNAAVPNNMNDTENITAAGNETKTVEENATDTPRASGSTTFVCKQDSVMLALIFLSSTITLFLI